MKQVFTLTVMLAALACAPAMAESAQQNRMKECNGQASGKTGDARKAFMSSCLKGGAAAPAPAAAAPAAAPAAADKKEVTPQQQRMRDCNTQAKGKTGDERKQFMSSCLKGSGNK